MTIESNFNKIKYVAKFLMYIALVLSFAFLLEGCGNTANKQVVIYTSVDQVYSEPILKDFEKKTGIKVLTVYDVEATKTVGLVNRIIAEKDNPRADVFWSGEFLQTMLLKGKNVLEKYTSPKASGLPKEFIDKDGYWIGFGGRARVLLVNKNLLSRDKYPKSIFDLLDSRYPGNSIGMAYPIFGTAATHAAALYASLGEKKAKSFFQKLKDKNVQVFDGNSVVRDMVASGKLTMGITDTDDSLQAVNSGKPVEIVFLDQDKDGLGTFVIPNTIAKIAGGPNSTAANKLIDYLVSKEIEEKLMKAGWIDIPSRSLSIPNLIAESKDLNIMKVEYGKIGRVHV